MSECPENPYTTDRPLGFCNRRQEVVTDEACNACFVHPDHVLIRSAVLDMGGRPRRWLCVTQNVVKVEDGRRPDDAQARIEVRDDVAEPEILRSDIEALPREALLAILGNAAQVANAHPTERAARTLRREVRFWMERLRKPEGDDQNPDGDAPCPCCGGTMVRRNRRDGTPETGLVVLACGNCEHEVLP